MIGYILALLPLYIFIYLPISQLLFPSSNPSTSTRSSSTSSHEDTFNSSFIAPEERHLICPPHYYSTHILSREPLVLYLENWLSEDEILHLIETRSAPPPPAPHPPFLCSAPLLPRTTKRKHYLMLISE
jgi:prolyl 4-hydroxylase